MKVNEYGSEHEKTVVMFQCAAEPGWVFIPSAKALAQDYHVFLFIADGHDELGTTFVSIEKYVDDAASYLKENGIRRLDLLYGVSMGGAAVIRFLATQDMIVDKAIIDAGITPELMQELDTTPDSNRVQEIYETILKSVADEALLIPLVFKNETSVWNADVIADYTYYYDPGYTLVQNIRLVYWQASTVLIESQGRFTFTRKRTRTPGMPPIPEGM